MQIIDDLIAKMKATSYEYVGYKGDKSKLQLLSSYDKNAEQAMRQIILEFIQQNTNGIQVENSQLKQRIFILEEVVKKSNFAPLLLSTPKEGE